jgi:hypothetical protein
MKRPPRSADIPAATHGKGVFGTPGWAGEKTAFLNILHVFQIAFQ